MSNQEQEHRDPESGLDGAYDPSETEPKWQQRWLDEETYAYGDETTDPNTIYSIDTPPPTVSGSLHMGHLYGSTLQDFAARYHRMKEGDVFFPFGYDDNGIASERLTERELDIRHQDYERREFQELCREVCREYEAQFTEEMQSLAVSIDWNNTYKTIEPRVQRLSQLSFIDLYEQGREYRQRGPAIWCPDCETAISQVETEDAERDSHYNDITFELVDHPEREASASESSSGERSEPRDRDGVTIATTRPELLPACVAMFVHPDDDANQDLVGKTARVPLFGHEVPIYEDERVDMEKGTGVVMCCTFGDQNDIEWYQAHDLDLRVAIDESATMTDLSGEYTGMSTHEAREAIVEELDAEGYLEGRRAITHAVQVHERCETDIEFRVTDQWYVKMLDRKEEYLEAGRSMDWYPEKMFTRYKHWVEGLEWDWCISRQRDSGIPFPVWYCDDCGDPVLARREDLPVDPLSDAPPVDACPKCGHDAFEPEEDVFDTWATSSLTPLINAGWDWDADLGEFTFDHPELYPFDLRPQGHDIISFWLFHTVVKCYEHTGEVPFESVMINGHVLDANREKMSKSKGNVVEPQAVLEEFPVDATRFWAAGTAVGDDFPFKENDLEAGEKLLQKLWNASKLVRSLAPESPDEPAELNEMDEWLLASMDDLTREVTDHFDAYEFSKARDKLRSFFWHTFCDDYLEIAKQQDTASTAFALRTAHERFLKLFAPFLPHITEELWYEMYGDTSVHRADWPEPLDYEADREAGETALEVVGALRGYKTDNGLALNADLDSVAVYGPIEGFEDAIAGAMHVAALERLDEAPDITSEIADIDLDYSLVGPEFGSKVGDIEAAIAQGDYEIRDGELHVADVTLSEEMFAVEEARTYSGEGEFVETEHAIVIVR
ncbi:valine--tRNA ligase [Halorarius litoreus]|uniref:valine--tRNA ligase n=1 Tax=Halorarius litoreus TaxID=2962676 RepID=UPI0020CC8B8E|nr:valine--tRNA ligase [Halorarius litoreus]